MVIRRWFVSLKCVLAAVALVLAPVVQAAPEALHVRIATADLAQFTALGIHPAKQETYSSFLWLELQAADVALLTQAGVRFELDERVAEIAVGKYRFDPLRNLPPTTPSAEDAGAGLKLLQFQGPLKNQWVETLKSSGLKVLQYYPNNAVLAWGGGEQLARASVAPEVRFSASFQNEFKYSPSLDGRLGRIENVEVFVYNDGQLEALKDRLRALGADVKKVYAAQPDLVFYSVIIEVDAARLSEVAALAQVVNLSYSSPRAYFDDELSDQINAGNYDAANVVTAPGYLPWLATLNLNGAGVTWAVTDSGVDIDHPDLVSAVTGGYTYPGCPAGTGPGDDNAGGGHGTHVAGIIAGRGVGDAGGPAAEADALGYLHGLGVAPGANIWAMTPICVGSVPWPPAGGWQENSKQALLGGATGTNNSWTSGEGAGVGYLASARSHDIIVRDGNFDTAVLEPFVLVFSGGNSGPNARTITSPKEAKNAIVVGSSVNQREGSINALSGFSSRGPAVDGRIMPTISAPGGTIHSTRRVQGGAACATAIAGTQTGVGTEALYAACSGTSMAAPHVSGSAALLTQWWRTNNARRTPSPAMLKALLINGAVDMTVPAPIPNSAEGWGRVSMPGSLSRNLLAEYVDQTRVLTSTGDSYALAVGVADQSKPLRITLVWTDAPGAPDANPALVNNLDLEVTTGATVYKGNVYSNGVSVSGGSFDALNNIETVLIPAPGGSASVSVRATALNADALAGNGAPGSARQDFALVCSNCVERPGYFLTVTPPSRQVCAPGNAAFEIEVGSILGYNSPVTLQTSAVPTGVSANLVESLVIPPGSTTLNLAASGGAAAGSFTMSLNATSTAGPQSQPIGLNVFTAAPISATLGTPADGATVSSVTPSLTWTGAAQSLTYTVQVATDSAFTNIVYSASGLTTPSATVSPALLADSLYHWRVRAVNPCGTGSFSGSQTFRTPVVPGQCPSARVARNLLNNDVEAGAGAWTHAPATAGGTNTWAISSEFAVSPTNAWRNTGHSSTSDQLLTSPVLALPINRNPLSLQFQQRRHFETRTAGCYDGGMVEVAVNGAAFTAVPAAQLLNDPYTGPGSGNPAGAAPIWCADPARPFANTIIDMTPYAGSSVQFRFRVVTDSSVARSGWAIDNIRVQSCATDLIFGSGFSAP